MTEPAEKTHPEPATRPAAAGAPLRIDARRNRDSLVAVARTVFAEQGIDASLRDVARRAGVGIGTLYRHFPTREALLEAVVSDGFDLLRDLAAEMMSEPSPRQSLATWMWRFATNSSTCRGLSGSMLASLHDSDSDLHRSSEAMLLAASRLLNRAQEAGEARRDISATDVITMAAATGWVGQITDEEQARRVLMVLLDGLSPADG
jgi:AcrR family transcriptional regulator